MIAISDSLTFILHHLQILFIFYHIPTKVLPVNRQEPKDQSRNKEKIKKSQAPKDLLSLEVVDHGEVGNSKFVSCGFLIT